MGEFNNLSEEAEQIEASKARMVQIAKNIVPSQMWQPTEAEACDLLMEVQLELIKQIEDKQRHADQYKEPNEKMRQQLIEAEAELSREKALTRQQLIEDCLQV